MPERRFTDLETLADPDDADVIPIDDVSVPRTKRLTIAELRAALGATIDWATFSPGTLLLIQVPGGDAGSLALATSTGGGPATLLSGGTAGGPVSVDGGSVASGAQAGMARVRGGRALAGSGAAGGDLVLTGGQGDTESDPVLHGVIQVGPQDTRAIESGNTFYGAAGTQWRHQGFFRLVDVTGSLATFADAGSGMLYARDEDGVVHLFFVDSDGTEHQLTPGASGGASAAADVSYDPTDSAPLTATDVQAVIEEFLGLTIAGFDSLTSDPRFSDARTPTAHAASHAPGGTDALESVELDTGTARNVANADHRKVVQFNSGSTITVTAPSGLTPGTTVEYVQLGTGQVQVAAGGGMTLVYPGTFLPRTSEQYSSLVVTILTSSTALVRGDLEVA